VTGDRTTDLIFYMLLLVLPLSALLSRRVRIGSLLKMAVAWILVFGAGLLVVGQRERLIAMFSGARTSLVGEDQTIVGETVRIRMAPDGHFYGDVTLNGVKRRMLIDSGATITALSARTARDAGIDVTADPFPAIIRTANGSVVANKARIGRLRLGAIEARDLPIVVSPAFGNIDVIGMNFLSRLRSWRVEGRILVLEPANTE